MIHQLDPSTYYLADHLDGFTIDLDNTIIESLPKVPLSVATEYFLPNKVTTKYPHIDFTFALDAKKQILNSLVDYHMHPELTFDNFLCSFNGSAHVGRRLLVSILNKFRYFDPAYCSKNFSYTESVIDGNITDYVDNKFYRKFFISADSEQFFQTIYSFGHNRFYHNKNIYTLERKLTSSFLHVVSETMSTSYLPFITEKFLYSVVTRGLFLAYAQPGWHSHLEMHLGFKKYHKLFDYRFDTIQNPVERLVELMTMISKFSMLSSDEWRDLYLLEMDTIEYNYNHYFSGNYLAKYE